MEIATLERTLTELDHLRLLNLLRREVQRCLPGHLNAIEEVVDSAIQVPSRDVAPDVVTMYSQVVLQDVDTGRRSTLTLCYPHDAEADRGFVSVLSPVGSAVLGLRIGGTANWSTPTGVQKAADIVAILFQPEASGDSAMSSPRAARRTSDFRPAGANLPSCDRTRHEGFRSSGVRAQPWP